MDNTYKLCALVAAVLLGISVWGYSSLVKRIDACEAKGGVLVRGGDGSLCVKTEALIR